MTTLAPLLGKGDKWHYKMRLLREDNIRPLPVGAAVGDGVAKLSWIWTSRGVKDDDEDEDAVRDGESFKLFELANERVELSLQYLQTRSHSMQWCEEVILLKEEMRRFQVFMQWQANWWETRVQVVKDSAERGPRGLCQSSSMAERCYAKPGRISLAVLC